MEDPYILNNSILVKKINLLEDNIISGTTLVTTANNQFLLSCIFSRT